MSAPRGPDASKPRSQVCRRQQHLSMHFFAVQEQGSKSRLRGTEAVKANILAAKTVARTLRSSLGPKGMDKMLQSPDGDVTISECCCMLVCAGRSVTHTPDTVISQQGVRQ